MLLHDRIRNFTPKEALSDLFVISEQLPPLIQSKPELENLINYICNRKYEKPDTLKTVSAKTGLKTHTLRKQIKELYLFVLETEGILKFNKVEYNLIYRFNGNYYNLELNHLPVIPNVGDTFEAYFLEAIMGVGTFTVERIWHHLRQDKQVVDIDLGEYVSPHKFKKNTD